MVEVKEELKVELPVLSSDLPLIETEKVKGLLQRVASLLSLTEEKEEIAVFNSIVDPVLAIKKNGKWFTIFRW